MNTKRFTTNITAGIAVALLLIVGTASTSILSTTYAQSATFGEPFFVEKGKSTVQKEIGPNRTQYTFAGNGTMNGNIEVTNSGDLVSLSKGNKGTSAQGQGIVTTKDGSEKANYTFLQVGKTTTKDGKPVLRGVGSAVWSTDSTGKLAFLDNMLSFFIIEVDEMGNFSSKDRELK
jgi:flagellar hook assembly protein FlgD